MDSNPDNTRAVGAFGESIAEKFLLEKGYKIIKKNFQFGKIGEIDIVAEDKEVLVFVEVKLRTAKSYGDPLESITPKKVANLRRTAEGYLYINKIYNKECRFDIIGIDTRTKPYTINHLINAIF